MTTSRWEMSSAESPGYPYTTLSTGISIFGKISMGVVYTARVPRIRISKDITTKVYGLRSAKRTIHIQDCCLPGTAGAGACRHKHKTRHMRYPRFQIPLDFRRVKFGVRGRF